MRDYTLVNVPEEIDARLREFAAKRDITPEQAAVEILAVRFDLSDTLEYIDLEELEPVL